HAVFEDILDDERAHLGHEFDTTMRAEDWQGIVERYKSAIRAELQMVFPQNPSEQLWGAIRAAFSNWMSTRAVTYRELRGIPAVSGTAINIQAMVFGNLDGQSATGIATTRNPSTGERRLHGEFLVSAQGEDVVAGIRKPHPVTAAGRVEAGSGKESLEECMPAAFSELSEACRTIESHFKDMQEVEFTVERGKLWMLQTRSGKRSGRSALKIAVDLAEEGVISEEEAVMRVAPASLDQFLHSTLDPDAERDPVGSGLPASPGAATGEIVFTSEDALAVAKEGRKAILVRTETSPEDVHGMHVAEGILTIRGGMTSHAAVVARGLGKPCVSGAGSLRLNSRAGTLLAKGCTLKKGDVVTLDGSAGQLFAGAVAMREPELPGDFLRIMQWADAARRMKVRANAETPADARAARSFGAEGIGLCRTEHMFFDAGRIGAMREMILSDSEEGRRAALAKLLPMQRSDFIELFEIMAGLPVTVRLLDPPLHEFLPKKETEIAEVAKSLGMDAELLAQRIGELSEFNPMLGHRGCRLAISYPEIAEMQARAIFEAAADVATRTGQPVALEIMVPLVSMASELDYVKARVDAVAKDVAAETGTPLAYLVGTMIELPRAAMRAEAIAGTAEFFSFGTNDLTQTTLGISRDDAGRFLSTYLKKGLIHRDPFATLDIAGVGELLRLASASGRKARPGIKLGV
ncbi:MAG TPA: pyruvate, phosphate dikinase, partial [Pararhizobium sp.]|nr:pyruvate, phosphate dikinase [Pararhizobium sp.]